MLELIFQGFFEWIYGLALDIWEYISGSLLDLMSMDFAYLQTHIPILPTIRQSMLAVGWALLIGNLVFQAARSMLAGLGFEAEDPKLLFTRSFVFSFLLLASPQICNLCLNMTSTVMDIMEVPNAANIQLIQESAFDGLACAWLLVFICGTIVMFQAFKLIFEMAERYFILAVLTITAPLAFGMGGSRNTSDIFTGWCRMYGSMCLLMVLNVVFVKMLLSVLSTVPTGLAVLPWIVLVLTIVKVAKKADAIITRIGLNPAITGDSLGRTFPGMLTYIVTRTAMSQVTKAIGKSTGKDGGRSPNAPNGGSLKNGGPQTSAAAKGARGAGDSTQRPQQNTNRESTAQQNTDRQSATQQSGSQNRAAQSGQSWRPANQPVTIIPDDAEAAAMEGPMPASGVTVPPQSSGGVGKNAARQSSVPPGAVRSPSLIRQSGAASAAAKSGATSTTVKGGATQSASMGTIGRNTSEQGFRSNATTTVIGGTHSTVRADTREKGNEIGAHGAAANGTAGNVSPAARFSNVPKNTGGSAEAAKAVRGTSDRTPERASAPSTAPAEQRAGQTRFTQREAVGSTAKQQTRATAQQESAPSSRMPSADRGQTRPMHSGIAGTDEPITTRQTSIGERHGRNTPLSGADADLSQRVSSTAPQESQPRPQTAPQTNGATAPLRSGTAGTARTGAGLEQTRRTAQKPLSTQNASPGPQTGIGTKPVAASSTTNGKQTTRKSATKKEG